MASTIDNIDSYLKKNKKPLFAKLNEWYGKRDTDANLLKSKWNAAQEAKGINNKLKAWNELQDELAHWTDNEELAAQEAELEERGEDNWTDPQARVDLDKLRFFGQLSNIPEVNDTDDLDVKEIYSQNYNPKQMKALAAQFGYDYEDKADRAEFLKKAGELIRDEDIKKIWNDDIYTSLVTPIAKEYAKQNYQNIDSDDYIGTQGPELPLVGNVGIGIPTNWKMAKGIGADVGVNTLMAGVPGGAVENVIGKGMVSRAVDNIAAPVARAGANMLLNDESAEDAAKNMVSEIATNYATPWLLKGATRKLDKYAQKELQKAETQVVNGTPKQAEKALQKLSQEQFNNVADRARAIEDKLKSGVAVMDDKGNIFKFSKDGKLLEGSEKDIQLGYLPYEDFDFYLQNKNVMRGPKWGPEGRNTTKNIDEALENPLAVPGLDIKNKSILLTAVQAGNKEQLKGQVTQLRKDAVAKQIRENVKNNKPATSGINAEELALFNDKKPKEGFWHWKGEQVSRAKDKVAESTAGQAGAAYLINLQGRSKWGGATLNSLGQFLPPQVSEKIDLSVKEKPNKKDPELQLTKRLYDLYKSNPKVYEKPQLPKKWSDYKIEDIFGE